MKKRTTRITLAKKPSLLRRATIDQIADELYRRFGALFLIMHIPPKQPDRVRVTISDEEPPLMLVREFAKQLEMLADRMEKGNTHWSEEDQGDGRG